MVGLRDTLGAKPRFGTYPPPNVAVSFGDDYVPILTLGSGLDLD